MSWLLGGWRGWVVWILAAALVASLGVSVSRGWMLDQQKARERELRRLLDAERARCDALDFEAAQAGEAAALGISTAKGGSDAPRPGRHEL